MFNEIKKYNNNGHFFFKRGDNLKQVSKSVPALHAKAGRLDYIWPVRLKSTYITKEQELNSG